MSSLIKGNYINYNSECPITIESIQEVSYVKPFEDIEVNLNMSDEEKKRVFEIEIEQKRTEIIEQAKIEAQVKANEEYEKILADARQKAEETIDRANNLLNEAEINKETIFKEAFDKGYRDGMNQAKNKINEANAILQDITKTRSEEVEAIAPEIVCLISDLFEKVIGQKLSTDEELILSLIENTLRSYELKDSVVAKVSNEDYDVVSQKKQEILSRLRNIDDIEIVKQDSLQKGDCVIVTQSGDIDSSISKQLEYFKATIEDILRNELYYDKS